jgi:hypothetical protein
MLDFSKFPLNSDTLSLRATVASGIFPKGDEETYFVYCKWTVFLPL